VLVIETDKTETEVEAPISGRIRPSGAVGDTFACGEVIGTVYADGEDVPDGPAPSGGGAPSGPLPEETAPDVAAPSAATPAPVAHVAAAVATTSTGRMIASPNARRVAAELGVDISTVAGTGPGGRITSEDVEDVASGRAAAVTAAPAAAPSPAAPSPATSATPPAAASAAAAPATAAARQLAELLGVDLTGVPADPTDGRISRDGVARHVRALLAGGAAAAPEGAAPRPTATGGSAPATQTPSETIRLSGMRGTIAKRMHASLQEMAQLTLTMDAAMDAVVADRTARKDAGSAPGFTDYVIAAAARALRSHPRVNSQVTDDGIALLPEVHVGLAVALDEGLIVPVVKNADRLSLGQLAPETTRLADAARSGSLTPDEATGGTFSVTALGMYGVDAFTPVINPPNAAILGVGRIRDELVVENGEGKVAKRMTLSLTWDHRVLDGAPAAEFTQTICQLLADPTQLV
ncbi:MAG: dihydrolipoamide acetyltransferase family protein, partial [Actinomycetota bacterium]